MYSVVSFVILLNFFFVHGQHVENNVIRWKVTKELYDKVEFELPTPGVILKNNRPLQIILEGYEASRMLASCWNSVDEYTFAATFDFQAGNFVIQVEEVTDNMSTEWKCRTWKYIFDYQYYTFKIHIKGKDQIKVTIDRQQLYYPLTNVSVLDYDGIVEYWYQDGQIIDLVCERDYKVKHEGKIRLKYYHSNGIQLIQTDSGDKTRYPLYLRKTMKIENNYDYIDCTYISKYKIEYTYRTIFRYKSASKISPLKITVNDMKLVPIQSDGDKMEYQYSSYDCEMLTVTCEMDEDAFGHLSLGSKDPDLVGNLKTEGEYFAKKLTKSFKMVRDFNGKSLLCEINGRSSEFSAEIFLLVDETDPIILGLPVKNVIQQYNTNAVEWVVDYWYTLDQILNLTCVSRNDMSYRWTVKRNFTENVFPFNYHVFSSKEENNETSIICDTSSGKATINLYVKPDLSSNNSLLNEGPIIQGLIENNIIGKPSKNATFWIADYWYSEGETLNLKCVTRSDRYQWLIKNGSTENYVTGFYPNHVFTLKQEHNGASIICDVTPGRAIINLYLQTRPDSELPTTDELPNQRGGNGPDKHFMLILGVSVAVSAIALITVFWVICCKMCKKKHTKQDSRDNLTSEQETPIPDYPSQWNDTSVYANTEDGVMITNSFYDTNHNPTYARPQKNAKHPTEPIYHNPEELNRGKVGNNNVVYAQVCKKNKPFDQLRKGNNTKSEPSEPLYSEILLAK